MLGSNFYNGTIRKYVALFGALFNDIQIDRYDYSTNTVTETIKVPLSYGPKERYIARLEENPDLLREANMVLPRIAFQIKGINYAPDRKLNTLIKNRAVTTDGNSMLSQYNPVPYDFDIELYVMTRNSDDATRIVEQILPFFKPDWTTAVNLIPELGITMDIPIVLKSVDYQDTYENNFQEKYYTLWTMTFTLKGYIFGPASTQGVIKKVEVNFYTPTTNTASEGVGTTKISEYVTVSPGLDANGNPTSNASISIPVGNISANSNYGYIVEFSTNIG